MSFESELMNVVEDHQWIDKKERLMSVVDRWTFRKPVFEDGEPVQLGMGYQRFDYGRETVNSITYTQGDEQYYRINQQRKNTMDERVKVYREPVLAADGLPLEVGQTVYHRTFGWNLEVTKIDGCGVHVTNGETESCFDAKSLTHTPPDTLDRIHKDVEMDPIDYCKKYGLSSEPAFLGLAACRKLMTSHIIDRTVKAMGGDADA